MDRLSIATIARQIKTKEDLLSLLNQIKFDEMNQNGISNKFYPFTIQHLTYYCNPNNVFHRYRQFKIKKKTGGFRDITAPRNRSYVLILRYINEILKSIYTPSQYAMGFIEERSVVTNAEKHIDQNYIFNIDLKDFFPCIERARIIKRLQLKPFNFPQEIALLIGGLCCMRKDCLSEDNNALKKYSYILPQGAPTSPIITNIICDKLDHQLAGLAKRFGLTYTRYADDITFSSNHNVYNEGSKFRKELERIITSQGFFINEKKTRLQKRGFRQEVTGIIVSKKLNVSKNYVRDIRNILYIWEKNGYNVAYTRFFKKYKEDKGHIKKGEPNLINVLDGKLMYLKMVKGNQDGVYQRLYTRFKHLISMSQSPIDSTNSRILYIETMTIQDFEKRNCLDVIININNNNRSAYFILEHIKIKISISKDIPNSDFSKDKLAISSCLDYHNKQFWLIHHQNKILYPISNNSNINIDALNIELDSLLNL